MGDSVLLWVSSSVVTDGADSERAAGKSSAKIRVGFGALLSQGKIGLGRSDAGGVPGISYIPFGGSGAFGAWNNVGSADMLYTVLGKLAASGREFDGGASLLKISCYYRILDRRCTYCIGSQSTE